MLPAMVVQPHGRRQARRDEVRLKSWELVELPGLTMRPDKEGRRLAIRIIATNDAVGVMPVRSCKDFSEATADPEDAQFAPLYDLHADPREWTNLANKPIRRNTGDNEEAGRNTGTVG